MSIHIQPEVFNFPKSSQSMRKISHGTASCAGHLVFEEVDGTEVIIGTESHEELICYTCIAIDPQTAKMQEQVKFLGVDRQGKDQLRWLDLVVTTKAGFVTAYSVKPVGRISDAFVLDLEVLAEQAFALGLVDDVRILSKSDFDETTIFNAKFLIAVRRPDPEADIAAREVARRLSGAASLSELTDQTGFDGRGFHALLRLVRSGHLGVLDHVRLDRNTHVYLKEILQ